MREFDCISGTIRTPVSQIRFVSNWTSLRSPFGFLLAQKSYSSLLHAPQKNATLADCVFFKVAGWTRLELATSCVTGRRSNQLNYHPLNFEMLFRHIGGLLSIRFLNFFRGCPK